MTNNSSTVLQPGERLISVGQAIALVQADQFLSAAKMCAEILDQMPDNATAICLRAYCDWRMQKDAKACVTEVRRALKMAPKSALVRLYLAPILISMGETVEAKSLLNEALELEPQNANALFDIVEIEKFVEETPLIKDFYRRLKADEFSGRNEELVGFALAKAYDDLKMPDRAISLVNDANLAANLDYDRVYHDDRIADLKKLSRLTFNKLPTSDDSADPPVFIVGMPRSGTTLVETILSRHPDVFAAGELNLMPQIEKKGYYWATSQGNLDAGPHTMLSHMTQDILAQNAAQVRKYVSHRADRPFKRFTDKLPMNALRLPLISRLFPNSPIIYMRRHPLDVSLSNLFKRFSRGLEFSFSQHTLGHYHQNMLAHVELSRQFISNPVLDVSYDLLVENFEPQVRRLVEFVGLDWNEACLSPEQSDRGTVMTASKWQVRQPIYSSSKAKWVRYEPYISDLIASYGGMNVIEAEYEAERAAGKID